MHSRHGGEKKLDMFCLTQNVDFVIITPLTQVFTQIFGTASNCCSNITLTEGQFHYTALPPLI